VRLMCCGWLQCVTVCCSVLQYAAVCCSVLQCVAVCCCMLPCVAKCFSVLHVAHIYIYTHIVDTPEVWCSALHAMLQCVAVCCSVRTYTYSLYMYICRNGVTWNRD